MNRIFLLFLLVSVSQAFALPPDLSEKQLASPPPRIIRTCCSFGTDVKVAGIPFMKITEITSVDKIGNHVYLGDNQEANGIVYTKKGGFIDLAHLRDQADWTAYLYSRLVKKDYESLFIQLAKEGGNKELELCPTEDISNNDLILLSGKIAYDLSVWHEIATFYGASYIPLVPERYSAFSMEDAFSNLLGVRLGIAALMSELPFAQAMDELLREKLIELEVVSTENETREAMELVRENWWSREFKLPSKNILLKREFEIENCLTPWLVPELSENQETEPVELCVPELTSNNISLEDMYELRIKLNHKFPVKKLLSKEAKRYITQKDFELLIQEAIRENGDIPFNRSRIRKEQASR